MASVQCPNTKLAHGSEDVVKSSLNKEHHKAEWVGKSLGFII